MKINDLGTSKKIRTDESVEDGQGVSGWLARKGVLGTNKGLQATQSYNTTNANTAYEKQWTQALKMAWDQAVQSGIASTAAPDNTANAYQNLSPEEKARWDAAKQRRDANYVKGQQVGQNPQQGQQQTQATQQQTQAATTAPAGQPQAQATQQAPQAEPAQQTTLSARDKMQQRLQANKQMKQMKESALDDYVMFNTLVENIVEDAAPQDPNAGKMAPGQWLMNYMEQTAQGQRIQLDKFKGPLEQLTKDFEQKVYAGKGAFPADVGKKLYSFWASAAASSPKTDQYGYSANATANTKAGQPGKPSDVDTTYKDNRQALVSKDPHKVAAAISNIISSIPDVDTKSLLLLLTQMVQQQANQAANPPQ